MTFQQLRAAHRAAPFRPFNIHMADGRSLHVRHPDFLFIAPSGRTAFVFQEDDDYSVVDLLLMTELKFGQPAASPSQSSSPTER